MAKELYLYSPIYDFVAEALIAQMEEAKGEDIVIRANTVGGSVFSGWGIIAKMKEHEGSVKVKVDGAVRSMGTFILVFANEAEALDVSRIHLHRADMYVNSPEEQKFLDDVNKDLRAKLSLKIDAAKLKEIKGVTIDELFDPTKRLELWLTAKEAKSIGLINKIVKLTPDEISAVNEMFMVAAEHKSNPPADQPPSPETKPKNTVMTLSEIKAQHPALYAEIMAAGKKEGVEAERERVEAWMQFSDIDAEAVTKGIAEGKDLSIKQMAEFTRKGMNAKSLDNVKADNAKDVTTTEVTEKEKTDKEKAVASFESEVLANLGLKV